MIINLQISKTEYLRVETMEKSVVVTEVMMTKGADMFKHRGIVTIPKAQLESLAIFLLQANREVKG